MRILTTVVGTGLALVGLASSGCWGQSIDDLRNCGDSKSTPDVAISSCSNLIQSGSLSQPHLALAFGSRGAAYLSKRDLDHAMQDLDQAIRLNPNYAEALSNQALIYYDRGDYDRAIQNLDQAILLNPNSAEMLSNRGNSYAGKGEFDLAIQDVDQAIRLNPSYAPAYVIRGSAYVGKGEFDRAMQDFDQAVQINPSYAPAYQQRGTAFVHGGQYDRAIQDFSQSLQLDPNEPVALHNRGFLYAAKGDFEHAIQDYDQVIRLDPGDADAYEKRGAFQFCLAQYENAKKSFAGALQLRPANLTDIVWLYLAQARAGDHSAQSSLAAMVGGLGLDPWPGKAVELFLGRATPESVLAAAKDSSPNREKKQFCEGYFYLGERAMVDGNRTEATRLFQQTLAIGREGDLQYLAAKEELRRFGDAPKP
jgi:lipoprotein NlpI